MKRKRLTAYILLYNFIGLTVAIGGWLWEVLLFFVKDRLFVNRGFLYGPYLPVYGIGAVFLSLLFYYKDLAVIVTYARFSADRFPKDFYHSQLYCRLQTLISVIIKQHLLQSKEEINMHKNCLPNTDKPRTGCIQNIRKTHLLENLRIFIISMLGGSLTELAAGWLLWHVFACRYWDYRGYPLNIGGYVCIYSALGFGLFGVLWMNWISPHLIRLWEKISFSIQILIIGLSDMLLLTDAVFSLMQPNSGKNITFSYIISAFAFLQHFI